MKKFILTIVLAISVSFISAQSFNGVPLEGDLTTCITRFKAKGFVVNKYIDNGAILKGKVANYQIELYVFTTPKSKKVYKAVAFVEKDLSWASLKYNYEKFVALFTEKYGTPTNKLERFIDPYYEGDGYEMTAVSTEKCEYYTLWLNTQLMNLGVEISKYEQVKLTYENVAMMEIMRKERAAIESNSF